MSTFANGNAGGGVSSKKNQANGNQMGERTGLLARPSRSEESPIGERATTEGEAESGLVASQEFYKDWQCTRLGSAAHLRTPPLTVRLAIE